MSYDVTDTLERRPERSYDLEGCAHLRCPDGTIVTVPHTSEGSFSDLVTVFAREVLKLHGVS